MSKESTNNVVLIGSKPLGAYLNSLELFLKKEKKPCAVVKARGSNIKKAIDIVQIAKNRFLKDLDLSIGEIKLYTVEYADENDRERSISCIDIELKK